MNNRECNVINKFRFLAISVEGELSHKKPRNAVGWTQQNGQPREGDELSRRKREYRLLEIGKRASTTQVRPLNSARAGLANRTSFCRRFLGSFGRLFALVHRPPPHLSLSFTQSVRR